MNSDPTDLTFRNNGTELYGRLRRIDLTRPTVVLLCGLGFHTFEYEPLATELATRGINTITFDYRGHGRSTGPRGRWTLADLANDTLAAISCARQHGLDRVHLVGNSLGGMIAILAGERDPHIDSVIASNTPAHVADFLLTRPRRLLYRIALLLSRIVPIRISVNHFYAYEQLTDNPAWVERINRDATITRARQLSMPTYRELLDTWDGPAAIHRLHRPVLLIHGNHDKLQPPAQTDQLYTAANEPKTRRVIEAGHLPHLDATSEFADLLTGWLERITS